MVAAAAAPGEILVSNAMREMVTGSGFRFQDRGKHELKGVSGEWRLFALEGLPAGTPFRTGRWIPELTTRQARLAALSILSILLITMTLWAVRGRTQSDGDSESGIISAVAPGIAVLPFTVQGDGLEVMREGMVSLLSTGLDGAGGLRTIAPGTVFARWRAQVSSEEMPELPTALKIARLTGARYALIGSVVSIGSNMRVVANVYEVGTGEWLGQGQVEGSSNDVLALVDRLGAEILGVILQRGEEELPEINLATLTTESPEALKSYHEGEVSFRRFDLTVTPFLSTVTIAGPWWNSGRSVGLTTAAGERKRRGGKYTGGRLRDLPIRAQRRSIHTSRWSGRCRGVTSTPNGTREFFQLKHRIFEFLVSEMDFTVFAIEATMPEAFDFNEYVLTGEGDPAKALAGLYFWTWNTEEVLDLIEWMRLYNADPTHERKVKFYGFDMQFATRGAKVTLDYLRAVDSEQLMVAEPALGALANPYTDGFVSWSEDRKEAAALAIEQILRRLEDYGSEYIAESDSMSWALARQHAEIVAQYIERMSRIGTAGGFAVRDSAMAENVRWILEREGPQAKLVLWAHNSHVSTQPPSMGAHLRGTFGSDMVVFGFAFNQGSFQAVERGQPSKGGLRSFTVEPAPEGSLGWVLAEAGLQLAAVDLREPPEDGPVAEWWNEPRPVREIGAGYSEESPSGFWAPRILPDLYDALLFVESTTPARSNPGGRLLGWTLLETPQNLDFEDSKPGEIPRGWLSGSLEAPWTAVPERQQDFDFHVLTTEDRSYRGERSGMIFRPAGRHYGEVLGTLGQRIEAEGYRGKRVRLRAAVRAEVSGPGNEAYLWVRVTKAYAFPPSIAFRDDRSITHDDWREYEIVGEVPPDAEVIDFGLALVGEGRAWIDTVALEAVDEE